MTKVATFVTYRLAAKNAEDINRRRAHFRDALANPNGSMAHIGNEAREGDELPMLVVVDHGAPSTPVSLVNGQVFLDGNDTLWVTSVGPQEEGGVYGVLPPAPMAVDLSTAAAEPAPVAPAV